MCPFAADLAGLISAFHGTDLEGDNNAAAKRFLGKEVDGTCDRWLESMSVGVCRAINACG